MRIRAWLLGGLLLGLTAATASAQDAGSFVVGAGGGATFYCIDTRCNAGTIIGLSSGYQFTPSLGAEVSGRSHMCFDCDRFLIGDAALLLQRPRARVRPYIGAGAGYASDPGFMGSRFGVLAAVGALAPLTDRWMLRADVRGRSLGSSGSMGEFTLWIQYRTVRR